MTCRICLEDVDTISVCNCKGTQKHVHLKCIQKWAHQQGATNCELCQHPYDDIVHRVVKTDQTDQTEAQETQETHTQFISILFATVLVVLHLYLIYWYSKYDRDNLFTVFMFSFIFNGLMGCGWAFIRQHHSELFLKYVVFSTLIYFILSILLQCYFSSFFLTIIYFDYIVTFLTCAIAIIFG
jgi:cation transport ATPase